MISVKKETIDHLLEKSKIIVETKLDKVTVVTVKLPNGFILIESSGAIDKENYSEELGKECCLNKIKNKLWMLEAYYITNKNYKKKKR